MTEHRTTINLATLEALRDQAEHSIFGPSSSAMWLLCSGSLVLNLLADDDAGYDAAYGTVAHGVTEQWLKSGKKPRHLLGTTVYVEFRADWWGFFVDIDIHMLDHCQTCVDSIVLEPGIHFYERKVDFSKITPIKRQRGTADVIVLQPDAITRKLRHGKTRVGARLIVEDHKFGTGYQVFAKDNTQGLLYALGAFYEFDFDYDILEIEIRIEQPRLNHSDVWVITREELLAFAEWAQPRAHAAWKVDAPLTPGVKQCRWCKVRGECAANAMMQLEMTAGSFDDLDKPVDTHAIEEFRIGLSAGLVKQPATITLLTVEEKVELLKHRKMVDAFWNALETDLDGMAAQHIAVPGMKLVEGRSNRVFISPSKAAAHLVELGVPRAKVVTEKVASPAEAEKLLREAGRRLRDIPALLDGYIRKPPGKPTLVLAHDPRPVLVDNTEGVFDALG